MGVDKISDVIKEKRKQLGMSQQELAHLVDEERTTISKWENGKTVPSLEKLIKLSKHLDFDLKQLIDMMVESPAQSKQLKKEKGKKIFIICVALVVLSIAIGLLNKPVDNNIIYDIKSKSKEFDVHGIYLKTPEFEIIDIHEIEVLDETLINKNAYYVDFALYSDSKLIIKINDVNKQLNINHKLKELPELIKNDSKMYIRENKAYNEYFENINTFKMRIVITYIDETKEIKEVEIPLSLNKI